MVLIEFGMCFIWSLFDQDAFNKLATFSWELCV